MRSKILLRGGTAAAALTLMMIGRMQLDELRMRALLLAAIPFSMVYDLFVGSLPALAGSAIAMAIGISMLRAAAISASALAV